MEYATPIAAGGGGCHSGFGTGFYTYPHHYLQQKEEEGTRMVMAIPEMIASMEIACSETAAAASDDTTKKIRKPYTITKSRESWTEEEHTKFVEALQRFDRDWKKIEAYVGSKTVIQLLDPCSSNSDCDFGTYCFSCLEGFSGSRCVRSMITDQFKLVNNSLPFNKYAFLTTHNSFAIVGEPSHTGVPRITFTNQEDTVTQQLNNGVRALMLDTYDFKGDVWLCHSSGGKCNDFTAFEPAIDTLKEIEAFLVANPLEIVTLILEDYVHAPNGLTNIFNQSGLLKFWFPLSRMPQNGQDWPLVSDMLANNQRLLVFTSIISKQDTEGIAYQWNFMVENQYGDDGMKSGNCSNRAESTPLTDTRKSLILANYFPSIPIEATACRHNSAELVNMLHTCYAAARNRWANFVAVDYYKRSDGRGAFQATDMLNGRLLCGCEDVHACAPGSTPGTSTP